MFSVCKLHSREIFSRAKASNRSRFFIFLFLLPRSVILYLCPLEPSKYFKYVLLSELWVYWRRNEFWKFRISCSFLYPRSPSIIASHINSSIWIMSKFHVTTQNFNLDPHRKYLWTHFIVLNVSLQCDTLKTLQQKSDGVRERNRQTTEKCSDFARKIIKIKGKQIPVNIIWSFSASLFVSIAETRISFHSVG